MRSETTESVTIRPNMARLLLYRAIPNMAAFVVVVGMLYLAGRVPLARKEDFQIVGLIFGVFLMAGIPVILLVLREALTVEISGDGIRNIFFRQSTALDDINSVWGHRWSVTWTAGESRMLLMFKSLWLPGPLVLDRESRTMLLDALRRHVPAEHPLRTRYEAFLRSRE